MKYTLNKNDEFAGPEPAKVIMDGKTTEKVSNFKYSGS